MVLIMQYMLNGILPHDPTNAKRMAKEASYYTIVGGQLYRRGFPNLYWNVSAQIGQFSCSKKFMKGLMATTLEEKY